MDFSRKAFIPALINHHILNRWKGLPMPSFSRRVLKFEVTKSILNSRLKNS